MKKINIFFITAIGLAVLSLNACKKDSFLDRYPVSDLTQQNFFANENDLNTYCNGLYSYLPSITTIALGDQQSDNYESNPYNRVVAGQTIVPTDASTAGWTWNYLRQVNYFLENYQRADASDEAKNHYAGVAKFFRAWFYFDKVKRFGDVPWYGTEILPNDSADLYKARDPRALVMDSVMADLNFAVNNIKESGPSGTITKWAALALQARIALHEGTFRKYQGIDNWQPFLQAAVTASEALMQSGNYTLYSTGNPAMDYKNLFLFYTPTDAQNKEVILGTFYSKELNATTALDGYMKAYGLSLTKGLLNSYLTTDGQPFNTVAGYDKLTIDKEFLNRDPRMAQTVLPPTLVYGDLNGAKILGPAPTGYQQIKYYDPNTPTWNTNYNAAIQFRLGEILLIYAEAKAELANRGTGNFSQSDLDKTINLLRDRAGMPHLMMNVAPDQSLASQYPNVSGTLKNIILEIRRERRIELACENFRYSDLMRWKAGNLLAQTFYGMYFPGLGLYDLNGDGANDIGLVTEKPANADPNVSYFIVGTDLFLSNNNSGNVVVNPSLQKTFEDPKNYYFPLPTTEILLNKNLTQNSGW